MIHKRPDCDRDFRFKFNTISRTCGVKNFCESIHLCQTYIQHIFCTYYKYTRLNNVTNKHLSNKLAKVLGLGSCNCNYWYIVFNSIIKFSSSYYSNFEIQLSLSSEDNNSMVLIEIS